jgi:hypothetical protein
VADSDQREQYKISQLVDNDCVTKARNEATWEGTCHGKNPRKKNYSTISN